MQGTLDTFSVVEVLQMLGRVRSSGTLHIECAERQIDVHFIQGLIAETRDSTRVYADTVLGSLLIKRALVTDDQLAEALADQEHNPKPIGTILVEKGFVHEADLRDVLSRQVANSFLAVKTAGAGTFMFVIDEQARPVDYITIDTNSVLIEVSSVGGDYVVAFNLLGQANTVLLLNRDYETLPRHSLPMGRDEFHVLTLIDDRRTVQEITDLSHLEEVTVISILGKFCEAGVLLARAEKQTRAAADDELLAHRDSVWAEVTKILDDVTGTETTIAAQPPRQQVEHPADAGVALKVGDMIDGLVDTEITPALQALEHDGAAAPFDETTAGPGPEPDEPASVATEAAETAKPAPEPTAASEASAEPMGEPPGEPAPVPESEAAPADDVDPLAALVAAFPGPPPDEAELEDVAGSVPEPAAPGPKAKTPPEPPIVPPAPVTEAGLPAAGAAPVPGGTGGFEFSGAAVAAAAQEPPAPADQPPAPPAAQPPAPPADQPPAPPAAQPPAPPAAQPPATPATQPPTPPAGEPAAVPPAADAVAADGDMPLLAETVHQSWEAEDDDAGEHDELTEEEIAASFSRDITRPPLGTGMDLPWDDEEQPAAPASPEASPGAPAADGAPGAAPGGTEGPPAPPRPEKALPPLTPEELDGKW